MNSKVWNENISINCPGVGKGKIVSANKIEEFLKEDSYNEKAIFKKRTNPPK